MPPRIDTLARQYTTALPPEDVAVLVAKVRAKAKRLAVVNDLPTSLDLAAQLDSRTVRTPALELVARRVIETVQTRDGRLVLSLPPQEGKSSLIRWTMLWLLIDDPDRRIAVTSYAASLAKTSGRIVRTLVETYGERVGLGVDRSHADASDWQIEGHVGGLRAVGVGGGLTGQPVDVLVVDDPIKDQAAADSPTIRGNLHEWWEAVALTRLAPGAPIVVIQTRWHEDDLAGRLETEGWPVVNIPAQADGKTSDALEREPGEWLLSARGRTDADWEAKRKAVGERTWAALYQGRPAPLEGGAFQRSWFDTWRVPALPAGCLPPTVIIDPADNAGDGDEAGIIVATSQPETGRVFILDDASAPMTVARWARIAMLTCVRRGAPTIAYERSLSQLPQRIREAWSGLHREATALHRANGDQETAVQRLMRRDDGTDVRAQHEQAVAEIAADVDTILGFGSTGPRLKPIVAKGSKQLRMQLIAPMVETGRAVLVGKFPQLEHQLATWAVGQDSPDRADAFAHACALLGGLSGVSSLGRANDRVPTTSTSLRNGSSNRLTRSTRR